jgi:tetratricopeptide (TPR) repeat protein
VAVTAIVALVLVLIIGGIWFASHGVDAAHYFKLGDADYFEHKDYDKAISGYTEAIRLDPTYVAAYFERGNAYLDKKNYHKAISDYNEVISLDPKYVTAYYNEAEST